MSGPFNSPPQRRRPVINITSLIDVMFLLLIFFMVSATFRGDESAFDIILPQAGTGEAGEEPPHTVAVAADGTYRFGGVEVDLQELGEAAAALFAEEPDTPIALRADEAAGFGPIVRALDVIRAAGGRRLVVPTRPLEE